MPRTDSGATDCVQSPIKMERNYFSLLIFFFKKSIFLLLLVSAAHYGYDVTANSMLCKIIVGEGGRGGRGASVLYNRRRGKENG